MQPFLCFDLQWPRVYVTRAWRRKTRRHHISISPPAPDIVDTIYRITQYPSVTCVPFNNHAVNAFAKDTVSCKSDDANALRQENIDGYKAWNLVS